jgi:hypothetical protein
MADGTKGKKFDKNKAAWSLIPFKQLEWIAKILTFGANKYGEEDWKYFISRDNNEDRYFSAALRHIVEWHRGEKLDEETNMPHLAHAICCLLFILWKDDNAKNKTTRDKYKS